MLAVSGGAAAGPVLPAGSGGEGPPHRDNLSCHGGFASDLEIPTPLRCSAAAAQEKLKWVSVVLLAALKTPRASRGVVRAPRAHPSAIHHLRLMFPAPRLEPEAPGAGRPCPARLRIRGADMVPCVNGSLWS